MQLEEAGKFIINKLNNELPKHLTYHNSRHARDVHNAAKLIGEQENITTAEMELLLTAAWYHDAGFLVKAKGHEEESCRIVRNTLPGYGYSENQIKRICAIIMATRLPQTPADHLGEILADADLDYLGRDDFFAIGDSLFRENKFTGTVMDKEEWDRSQVRFMHNHQYFTKTAVNLRQPKKDANLGQIKARLNKVIK